MNVRLLSYGWCVLFCAVCAGLLYFGVTDMFFNPRMPNDCHMTYMLPQYKKVLLSKNATELGPQLGKYNLYVYTERGVGDVQAKSQLQLQPVLFVPGNAGSYKQVRSIASEAARRTKALERDNRLLTKFVFYAIDFREEFSAFNGETLMSQTRFTDFCVREILSKHGAGSRLILLGHSMGGVIAHGVAKMYNYDQSTVRGIVTLNTPHKHPVFAHSLALNSYYRSINRQNETANGVNGIPMVSIGGGFRDSLVNTKLTEIGYINNSFSAISSSIPGVWASADHQCITWCNQMMIALDRTLRVISETKLQTRVIKEVRNLLSSKLPSMMVDCVVPKTKRVSKGLDLGVKESDKKIAITELPLMTSTHANEWYEFDAKAYFDTKSNGRGAVVVIAEDSKNMKTYICTNDKSKCLDVSESYEVINNKYRKENNPTPESMLWLDYHAETGLGSHADMSKLVIHAQGYVPSLQVQGFTGTEGTLPSPLNMKDISETQRYKAPSTGIHIAGPTWADNRPLYVRVHSGEAIRTATYLVVGVFTPSSSEHAPEVVVKTVVNGNAVRVASHYSAQALDVFVVQLTKGTAPFTVEATLDVGGILGTCLRDSYRFAVALAIASLFIARIGVFTETRSTLYTVLVQSPALMIALGTSLLLLLGKHLRPVDALRDIGLGELLMATALSNALAVLVEAAALAVVGAAKALNRLLPGVGGNRLVMGIVLSLPSFCSIVAAAVCLAETIENRTRTGKGAVGKLARHTLRLLVIPAALSAIEAATATSAAQLFLKGLVLDGYKLVALAAVLGCTFAKTGLEKMKAPYSVFSLVTVAIGVAIAVFGTNEYCTACVVAVWANILI